MGNSTSDPGLWRTIGARSTTSTRTAGHRRCTTKRALRLTPDGKAVLYTSDLTAYSNMYLVEVGEFDELPDLE
jgi:hypothetical protein